MSWAAAMILVVLAACVLPLLFAEIAHRFNQPDEIDHVAERKRRTVKRARQISREYQ